VNFRASGIKNGLDRRQEIRHGEEPAIVFRRGVLSRAAAVFDVQFDEFPQQGGPSRPGEGAQVVLDLRTLALLPDILVAVTVLVHLLHDLQRQGLAIWWGSVIHGPAPVSRYSVSDRVCVPPWAATGPICPRSRRCCTLPSSTAPPSAAGHLPACRAAACTPRR